MTDRFVRGDLNVSSKDQGRRKQVATEKSQQEAFEEEIKFGVPLFVNFQ